jgi:hypothetical protein
MAGEPHLSADDIAVGIDLGSREHAVVVLDPAGRRLTRFRVPHSRVGFAELVPRPASVGRRTISGVRRATARPTGTAKCAAHCRPRHAACCEHAAGGCRLPRIALSPVTRSSGDPQSSRTGRVACHKRAAGWHAARTKGAVSLSPPVPGLRGGPAAHRRVQRARQHRGSWSAWGTGRALRRAVMHCRRLREGIPTYPPIRGAGLIFDPRASPFGGIRAKRLWCPMNPVRYSSAHKGIFRGS